MEISTLEEIIKENKFIELQLKKLPQKKYRTLKTLVNIYIGTCLEAKGMEKQKKTVEKYLKGISKEYDISNSYFKQFINVIEAYYCKTEQREIYKGKTK